MKDYDENIDFARSRDVSFLVIGSDRDMPLHSVIGKVLIVGKPKQDKIGDGIVRWISLKIIESNITSFPTNMGCWLKVPDEMWNEMISNVTYPVGRNLLIRDPGSPRFKPNDNIFFVFNFGSISFVF